jgi:hypothetical protein
MPTATFLRRKTCGKGIANQVPLDAVRLKSIMTGLTTWKSAASPHALVAAGLSLAWRDGSGDPREGEFNRRLHYGDECLLGAMDAKQRMQRLDLEGLNARSFTRVSVSRGRPNVRMRTSAGIVSSLQPRIVDWCADSGGRLIPVAHLSW